MIVTYKTHILLGLKEGSSPCGIARWEHVPTGAEVAAERDKVLSTYTEFVLVQPVGDVYAGTYEPTVYNDCGG